MSLFITNSLLLMLLQRRLNKQQSQALELQVYQDALTGVGNRRGGEAILKERFLQFKRGSSTVAIALFDLDYFKHINDTFGHDSGDQCLIQLAKTLQDKICSKDALYRWGGDEFLILCQIENPATMAATLLETVRSIEIPVETTTIHLSVSVGITSFHDNDNTIEDVLKRADKALYKAKNLGRDRYELDW